MADNNKNINLSGITTFRFDNDPRETSIRFEEKIKRHTDFVWWGSDNLFPQQMSQLYRDSATHGSILMTKTNLTNGSDGWEQPTTPQLTQFMSNENGNESLQKMLASVSSDLNIQGGITLNVQWSDDGSQIAAINYIPTEKVRIHPPITEDNIQDVRLKHPNIELIPDVEYYLVNPNWRWATKNRGKGSVLVQGFSEEHKDNRSQLLFIKTNMIGSDFYPQPSFIGGLNFIQIERDISQHFLSSLERGFFPSIHIHNNSGQPTPEQMDELYNNLQKKYKSVRNSGEIFLTFSHGKDKSVEISPIENGFTPDLFKNLQEFTSQQILVAHQITSPSSVGMRVSGQLGPSREEISTAFLIFNDLIIKPRQKIIEKAFNELALINGITEEMKLTEPLSFADGNSNTNDENIIQ